MKTKLIPGIALFALLSTPVHAAGTAPNGASAAPQGVGSVDRIDKAAGKVTLTHGPIRSLGWPGMTMAFAVKDRAALNMLKVGEKVKFDLAKGTDGQYAITRITPAK